MKVVQREIHILEGKKRSWAESEKGNVMEGMETLVEGKKKNSVVRSWRVWWRGLLVIERKWSLVEGMEGMKIGKWVPLERQM